MDRFSEFTSVSVCRQMLKRLDVCRFLPAALFLQVIMFLPPVMLFPTHAEKLIAKAPGEQIIMPPGAELFSMTDASLHTKIGLRIQPTGDPDLAISGIEVPVSVIRGDRVPVTVTVRNTSQTNITDDTVITLFNRTTGQTIGTRTLEGGLRGNRTASFTYNWDSSSASDGIQVLEARHDYVDTNRSNNLLTATVAVNQPLENDLAVTALDAPLSVLHGEVITLSATIANLSWRDVTESFDVILSEDEREIGRQTHQEGVNAGEEVNLLFRWDTGPSPPGVHTLVVFAAHSDENPDNNARSTSITVVERQPHDIEVTRLVMQEEIVHGQTVPVLVWLRNVGLEDIQGEFDIILTNYTNSREIGRHIWTGEMAPGDSTSFSFRWDTNEVMPGNLVLVASHNFEDDNRDNNLRTAAVDITEADLTDVAVTGISADREVEHGDQVNLSIAVQNLGNQNVNKDIRVTLYNRTDNREIGSELIRGGLARDNSITLSFSWDTTDATVRSHLLVASHDLEDDNDANNSLSSTIRVRAPDSSPSINQSNQSINQRD